ncbi:MAG: formate dehydrogenase accessory sulfurtransferase FdhD [Undibacterium sp.]|nr:formate dehydrogenase accessory sulfurtransferase FdhD [Opitutaceae bacterium]
MFPDSATRPTGVITLKGAARTERDDVLAVEEPLEIRVGGRSVAVVMRTPGHDRKLVAGFLVTEGILRSREEVLDMVYCRRRTEEALGNLEAQQKGPQENVLDVLLAPGVVVDWARLTRNGHAFFAEAPPLTGCVLGVSGRVSSEIMQKALLAGIPCVAAVSAPTSAAVEFARASGQTLVGVVRGARMNVYAGTLAG